MSPALLKMWVSFAGMGFMVVAVLLIMLSRYKLKGIVRGIVAFVAYGLMIYAGIIMFFVVFSGPTSD